MGTVELVKLEFGRIKKRQMVHDRLAIRQDVGFYILLSLEFLIAANIMRTILHPSLNELAVLGGIVGIRTVISVFLTREMQQSGRMPETAE